MGCLTAFVGFASSFAVVFHGLQAVGATDAQAASGLMALSVAMGLCANILSVVTRLPISIAWSTPGAALLASAGAIEGGFPAAVGAFLICGVLIVIAGLLRPFGRAVAAIPAPLANAMLAGVLLGLWCLVTGYDAHRGNITEFLKNATMAGGFFALAAIGPGALSLFGGVPSGIFAYLP